jgi:hypothetical protein
MIGCCEHCNDFLDSMEAMDSGPCEFVGCATLVCTNPFLKHNVLICNPC